MNNSRGFKYDIREDKMHVMPVELQAYLNEIELRLKMLEKHQEKQDKDADDK